MKMLEKLSFFILLQLLLDLLRLSGGAHDEDRVHLRVEEVVQTGDGLLQLSVELLPLLDLQRGRQAVGGVPQPSMLSSSNGIYSSHLLLV